MDSIAVAMGEQFLKAKFVIPSDLAFAVPAVRRKILDFIEQGTEKRAADRGVVEINAARAVLSASSEEEVATCPHVPARIMGVEGRFRALVDTGSQVNIMTTKAFVENGLERVYAVDVEEIAVRGVGGLSKSEGWVTSVGVELGSIVIPARFMLLDGDGAYDLILGMPWIRAASATCCINRKTGNMDVWIERFNPETGLTRRVTVRGACEGGDRESKL